MSSGEKSLRILGANPIKDALGRDFKGTVQRDLRGVKSGTNR